MLAKWKPADVPASLGLTPRAAEVLCQARLLLSRNGEAALTMRALGERLGMQAPSLYKHFADKEALEVALIAWGLEEIAALLAPCARATRPLHAIARVYREYASGDPHLYRLITDRPLPRAQLPTGLETRAAAPLLAAAGGQNLARALWAFAHGMVSLELAGRFPKNADLDAAWRAGIDALHARRKS